MTKAVNSKGFLASYPEQGCTKQAGLSTISKLAASMNKLGGICLRVNNDTED